MKRPLCLASVVFLGIWLFLAGGLQLSEDQKPSPLEQYTRDGDELILQGTVSKREERPEYQILSLTDVQIRHKEQFIAESKLLVYVEQISNQTTEKETDSDCVSVGSRIRVIGEVQFFEEARNPGNFDRKFYYRKQGIHASVWADSCQIIEKKNGDIREYLTRFRIKWKELLIECLGETYGNCMSAILIGDKSELDEEIKDLYQKSGIGHILAISGLHMSFIGIGLYRILRKIGIPFLPAGLIGITFLLLYTCMIGSGVSSQRALVMFAVRVGADMSGRDYDLPTSLAFAAAVIVFCQPLYLFDAGFLLSFGALLGIAVVEPVLKIYSVVPGFLRGGTAIHLVLLPILLYYYYEIPTYSLLLNLAVIPLMSFVLGAGIFGSLAALFDMQIGKAVLSICKWILRGYETGAFGSLSLPYGRIVTGQPEKWMIVLYYLLLFGGCAAAMYASGKMAVKKQTAGTKKAKEKMAEVWLGSRLIRACICAGIPLFCAATLLTHRVEGEVRVTMIDVGQGDGFYLKSPSGSHCMIDGGSTDVSSVGAYRIEPFLKSQGVGMLDYVFVSHGDEDHLSGIRELLLSQKFGIRIGKLILPDEQVLDGALLELANTAEQTGTEVGVIHAGEQWSDGEMYLKCLAPSREYDGESGNAASMVLELDYGNFEMLFTGDVEGEGEDALVQAKCLRDYDILKAAHHGSKNSTTKAFLEQTRPEITWISAGINNRYGHPHKETVERLENAGSITMKTQDFGAVTVYTDGKQMRMEMFCKIKDFPI